MSAKNRIDTKQGARLFYDGRHGATDLWISLNDRDTLSDVKDASESLIVAQSASDIDELIAALVEAKTFFAESAR